MAKLLNDKELFELTGYKNPQKIKQALADLGIGFVLDKDGKAKTTWVTVDAVLAGDRPTAMPNFEALDG